tara:strand:+ start:772 stop:1104 length:333 start_codon:yes stop_codon:yes gene_type:complete
MEITREQLKRIIAEEIDRFDLEDELRVKEEPDVGSISESEGVAMVQQLADLISQSGLTAVENPDEAYKLVMGLGKAALLPFFALTTGYAATSLKDAIDYLRNKDQKSQEK